MAVNQQLQAFVERVNTSYDGIGASADSIVSSLTGITADVDFLKATIQELQNTPGTFSPEDQALVDALEARTNALAGSLSAASSTAAALDAATEQAPTPTP